MAAPNFECEDGRIGGPGPCQRQDDGSCRWIFVDCAPKKSDPALAPEVEAPLAAEVASEPVAEKKPRPQPRPRYTQQGAKRCGRLPPVKRLKSWKIHGYCGPGSSFAGPPPPGGYRTASPKPIKQLGDGSFITLHATLGCVRMKARRCLNKCLAPDTLIDTPAGEIAIDALEPGQLVWTLDAAGARVAAPVLRVQRVPAGPEHRMIHLRLADGRSLTVSPGHPVAGGLGVETLRAGSVYDGAVVEAAALAPYEHDATHDLLPAGETGLYWANGVLLGSTISVTATR